MDRHNIDPKRALEIYLDCMKIEESFKDLKSLLGLERIMSKDRQYMEKLIMLVLIAYTIGVLVGKKIRDRMYRSEKKWNRYSGLFILTRQRVILPGKEIGKMKVIALPAIPTDAPCYRSCPNLVREVRFCY